MLLDERLIEKMVDSLVYGVTLALHLFSHSLTHSLYLSLPTSLSFLLSLSRSRSSPALRSATITFISISTGFGTGGLVFALICCCVFLPSLEIYFVHLLDNIALNLLSLLLNLSSWDIFSLFVLFFLHVDINILITSFALRKKIEIT